MVQIKRRNTKNIAFNEQEYADIVLAAKNAGLYPRQLLIMLVKSHLEVERIVHVI